MRCILLFILNCLHPRIFSMVWGLVIESLQFLKSKGAHKFWRFVKFPILFGMGPVSRLPKRYLHPNVHTQVRVGVKFKVNHIKCALHSTLCFKVPPSKNLLYGLSPHEESLQFLTPKGAYKYWRFVKFPMLFGMRPVSWFPEKDLHPNVRKRVRFGVKFKVHHMKYALHSTLYFKVPPTKNLLHGVRPWDRVPPVSHTRGSSQVFKVRQIPDVVWDGACEIVAIKVSAPKCTYTGKVQDFDVHHIKYVLHSTQYLSKNPFIYFGLEAQTILSKPTMIPLIKDTHL